MGEYVSISCIARSILSSASEVTYAEGTYTQTALGYMVYVRYAICSYPVPCSSALLQPDGSFCLNGARFHCFVGILIAGQYIYLPT